MEAMADLPRKAVTRTARLAGLPLGYAGRHALGVGRRLGGAPAEVVMNEVQARTAAQLFRTLGELKGGAMKFGQALSIFEGALPEEIAAPYREQLTKLQDAAPPMSAAVVHQQLVKEFGAGWKRSLIEFDDTPAASASIGQVHRGRWRDGTEVAIKVQYPGAEEALLADLRQVSRLARTFGSLLPGLDVRVLAEELRDRVVEELDYQLEAEAQAAFAAEFADDERYAVPRVLQAGTRAIVTEWMPGQGSLATIIDHGSQEERDQWGLLYARFMFEAPARTGLLHADPHPGNFRLIPGSDGRPDRLGVLDYGAVARLPAGAMPASLGRLGQISLLDDYDAVERGLRDEGFIKQNIRVSPADLKSYLGPFMEPARTETFRFSRDFMRAQMQRVQDPRSPEVQTALRLNMPPEYLLIHRTLVGGIGVLCQLEAHVPFRGILEELLPGFADPL
jgi:predicted unusual protein kinase regulating ubiquinone biosynthesis (AarF/ABC1/UbiB family)